MKRPPVLGYRRRGEGEPARDPFTVRDIVLIILAFVVTLSFPYIVLRLLLLIVGFDPYP